MLIVVPVNVAAWVYLCYIHCFQVLEGHPYAELHSALRMKLWACLSMPPVVGLVEVAVKSGREGSWACFPEPVTRGTQRWVGRGPVELSDSLQGYSLSRLFRWVQKVLRLGLVRHDIQAKMPMTWYAH